MLVDVMCAWLAFLLLQLDFKNAILNTFSSVEKTVCSSESRMNTAAGSFVEFFAVPCSCILSLGLGQHQHNRKGWGEAINSLCARGGSKSDATWSRGGWHHWACKFLGQFCKAFYCIHMRPMSDFTSSVIAPNTLITLHVLRQWVFWNEAFGTYCFELQGLQ